MTTATTLARAALLGLAMLGTAASAQTVLSGDHSVDGALCVGLECTGSETFGNAALKLKSALPWITFDDTSLSDFADRDWRIIVAGTSLDEYFAIQDLNSSRTPFKIDGGAPENAFVLDASGDVGLGTSLPQSDLHILMGTSEQD